MINFIRPQPPKLMLTGRAIDIYAANARRAAVAWEEYGQAVARLVELTEMEGDITASRILALLEARRNVLRIEIRMVSQLPPAWWKDTSAEKGVRLRDWDITLRDVVKNLVTQHLDALISLGIVEPNDMQRWEDPGLWEKLQQMGV